MNTEDPRKGWTSASNAQADRLCPGRHLAQKGLHNSNGKDAEFGTKVHAALAGEIPPTKLTAEQRDIYDSHLEVEKRLIAKLWGNAPTHNTKIWRHERYWCRIPATPDFIGPAFKHSGECDFVMRRGNRVLIQDYKSLAGEVAESPRNEQLRDQAVMVWRVLLPDEIFVAINQPLVTWDPELCRYTEEELVIAEREMWERVKASSMPNAPRYAGELQCKFCRAKSTCTEYAVWSGQNMPAVVAKNSPFLVAMHNWTPEQRTQVADHIPRLRKLLDEAEAFLKTSLEKDPASVPGFELKSSGSVETITDPKELFTRFTTVGGTLDQYMKCLKVVKKDLHEQLHQATQLNGAALKNKMKDLLEGITESKKKAPSLVKKE